MDDIRIEKIRTDIQRELALAHDYFAAADVLFSNECYRDCLTLYRPALQHQIRAVTLLRQDILPETSALIDRCESEPPEGMPEKLGAEWRPGRFLAESEALHARLSRIANPSISTHDRRAVERLHWQLGAFVHGTTAKLRRALRTEGERKRRRLLWIIVAGLIAAAILGRAAYYYVSVSGKGLKAEYFSGENFDRLLATRIDPVLDLKFDAAELPPGVPGSVFSARWTGEIYIPRSGRRDFSLESDDGSRLFIDDALVLESWKIQAMNPVFGSAQLDKGWHKVKVEYFNGGGGAGLKLKWSEDDEEPSVVPRSYLRPD